MRILPVPTLVAFKVNETDTDGNMAFKNIIFEYSIMDWVEKLNSNFTFHFFIQQYFKG